MRTAEVDELRSLFLLVYHIRGRTRQYQGAEGRNIDKLLSSLFSFSFLCSRLGGPLTFIQKA